MKTLLAALALSLAACTAAPEPTACRIHCHHPDVLAQIRQDIDR